MLVEKGNCVGCYWGNLCGGSTVARLQREEGPARVILSQLIMLKGGTCAGDIEEIVNNDQIKSGHNPCFTLKQHEPTIRNDDADFYVSV